MQAASTQPHGHLVQFLTKGPMGSKMTVRNTTGVLLGRGVHVGDVFVSLPVIATAQQTTVVATDYTKSGMATLDSNGVRGVIQTPTALMSTATVAADTNQSFARAFVVLAAQNSPVKPQHGMTAAQIATVSTDEPIGGSNATRLVPIDGDVRATCGRGVVFARVFLPTGVTSLVAGTPLVVYGPQICTLASAALANPGARIVGYLHRAITGATANAVTLAEVDFDGDHGFGMVVVDPS